MEQILISFDEEEYKKAMSRHNLEVNKFNDLISEVNQINGYKLDKKAIYDLIHREGELADEGITESVISDLDRVGIRSKAVRDQSVRSDREAYYTLIKKYERRKSQSIHAIEIGDDCTIRLKANVEQDTRDMFSHYIKTEKGKAIYDAQMRVVDALNEILYLSKAYNSLTVSTIYGGVFMERKVEMIPQRYDEL